MAQSKHNRSSPPANRGKRISKNRTRVASKNIREVSSKTKLLSILILSIIISSLLLLVKHEVVNSLFNFYCQPIPPGEYASETVINAVNLHHQIRENPNNEDKLLEFLNDNVIWFRKSKTATPKEMIRKFSSYDKFCFGSSPEFTLKDEMQNNYQMTFIGFHRFRRPDSIFCKIENYYCEILGGKINQIYRVPIRSIDEARINKINLLFKHFFLIVFMIVLMFISTINYLTTLPEAIIRIAWDLLKKALPL